MTLSPAFLYAEIRELGFLFMADKTYPIFVESDGDIFKISDVNGILVADRWDKTSRTFVRISSSAAVLSDGSEISPSSLPAEIRNAPSAFN